MSKMENIRVGIHQPNFFPWLGFFQKMKEVDVFILLDTVSIVLGSSKAITHRTKIKTAQGDQWLTLPLIVDDSKIIADIKCEIDAQWKKKFVESLRHNYSKAPFFDEVMQLINLCLPEGVHDLSKINADCINAIAAYLGITTKILSASDLAVESIDKNQRIVDLVKEVNGTTYLSGNGARSYNDETLFNANGISLEYMKFQAPVYPQFHGEFVPGLSILDYLFHQGNGR